MRSTHLDSMCAEIRSPAADASPAASASRIVRCSALVRFSAAAHTNIMRRSMESLAAKNALVTGTSRGIGRALAQALSDAGARVLCHARTLADATEVAEAVGGVPIFGDLGRPAELEQIATQVDEAVAALHVLAHNAAINPRPREELGEIDAQVFEAVIGVNVAAPILLTQRLLPRLRAAGAARVVFISSEAGQFDGGMRPDGLSYAVSKAALNAASAVIASAVRPDGILVNAVHPGWVRTGMGGPDAPLQPEQATATALMLATLPPDGPSGCFFFEGREIPW
jgi:NAD(P)-dependent dehydrogenase (short-subunit alcohol dehydrogenase family)